ncbi:prepilin peptidase [Vagococcus sp.]|uniref:prepilin peptidase n=1 Tax=Vagococcus sp. TaxID=1933889 RepID=UPI002FCB822E
MILIFFIGTIFGSFFAVLAKRIPINECFTTERSKCDHCQTTLNWLDLFPFYVLLFHKNNCRYCQQAIHNYHSIFEILTGITFLIFYTHFPISWNYFYLLLLWLMGLTLSLTDYLYYLVEPKIMYSLSCFALISFFITHGFSLHYFISTAFILILFLLLSLYLPKSIGGGDIKLLLIWSIFLSILDLLWLLLIASLTGIIFIVLTRLLFKKKLIKLPFVPFLTFALFLVTLIFY